MTWIRILSAILLIGCACESTHEKKEPVKHHRTRHQAEGSHPPSTPTPTPLQKKPLDLEHMGEPTPVIKPQVSNLSNINRYM